LFKKTTILLINVVVYFVGLPTIFECDFAVRYILNKKALLGLTVDFGTLLIGSERLQRKSTTKYNRANKKEG
jgi:hypothetical protein